MGKILFHFMSELRQRVYFNGYTAKTLLLMIKAKQQSKSTKGLDTVIKNVLVKTIPKIPYNE